MADSAEPEVDIRVTRTGGLAGVRRGWCVESRDSGEWEPLVEACPWDDDGIVVDTGADRFVWRIEVLAPAPQRTAELPDAAVEGPWRALVVRVRDEGAPVRPARTTR